MTLLDSTTGAADRTLITVAVVARSVQCTGLPRKVDVRDVASELSKMDCVDSCITTPSMRSAGQRRGSTLRRAALKACCTDQLQHLVCGMEHAIRLGGPRDRKLILDVLLAGIRVDASSTAKGRARAGSRSRAADP